MPPTDPLDLLPDGVVLAGPDRRVTAVSAVAASMLGRDAGVLVGLELAEVLGLRDADGHDWYACCRPYDGPGSRTGVPERSVLLPDGQEVLLTARLHRPGRGAPVETVAVALRSGRGRARLDRDRSDLVATVAHELRSPLTGVKGFVQALLNRWDRLDDDQKKLMLHTVSSDADRLSRLITELLDVARIDTGRLQLHLRPCQAGVLVTRVVESVTAGTATPVELHVATGLPPVLADPDKFTQVVTNLVENAVRHGAGTVRVDLAAAKDAPGVVLVVDDEGDGVPAALRPQVFTKFWKGGAHGGSGLGLYLVHGLTLAHGGSVAIQDAPGGGARLVVRWPAYDEDPPG